jgi:hypothetical protein
MKTIVLFCMRGAVVVVLALAVLFVLPVAHPIQLAMLGWITSVVVFVQSVAWLGIAGVVIIAATWAYSNMQMEAPDEYGQWRLPRSYLRKHPEIALQSNQQHQQIRIVQARYQVPHHYAPKFAAPVDVPQLEAAPPALPSAPPFADMLHTGWRPTFDRMLLGHSVDGPVYGGIDDLLSTAIAGRPGTGKSTAQRFIMAQAYAAGAQIAVIDPHGSLIDLAPKDMIDLRAEDGVEFVRVAAELEEEITDRLAGWKTGQRTFEPYVVMVDELPVLAADYPDVIRTLRRIILEARKVRMYALISGQGLPAEYFGNSVVRDGLSTRFIFWCTAAQARMAGLDTRQAGDLLAALQHDPKGKAILARSSADPLIVAIPNTTGNDLATLRTMRHTTSAAVLAAGAVPWINAAGSHMHDQENGAQRVVADARSTISAISTASDATEPPKTALEISANSAISADKHARFYALGGKPEDIDRILLLARADGVTISRRAIARTIYNADGGDPYKRVAAVLDAEGMTAKRL